MRWNLRLFQLGFFCVLVLLSTGSVAVASGGSGKVTMFVEVAPGFAISVQDSLTFPQAAPGRSVEAELDVTVWSNVDWQLRATATTVRSEDGTPMTSKAALRFWIESAWRNLLIGERIIVMSQQPTPSEGETISVPFRFQPGFGDGPGTYYPSAVHGGARSGDGLSFHSDTARLCVVRGCHAGLMVSPVKVEAHDVSYDEIVLNLAELAGQEQELHFSLGS